MMRRSIVVIKESKRKMASKDLRMYKALQNVLGLNKKYISEVDARLCNRTEKAESKNDCSMKLLLHKSVSTAETVSKYLKRTHESVIETCRNKASAMVSLVRTVTESNDVHDSEISMARAAAEQDALKSSEDLMQDWDRLSARQKGDVSGISTSVQVQTNAIEVFRNDYSMQTAGILASSMSQQNQQLECIDKLCLLLLHNHDEAVTGLKRKVLASKTLHMSHVEALQNVVRFHKAGVDATLQEIASLASSDARSIEETITEPSSKLSAHASEMEEKQIKSICEFQKEFEEQIKYDAEKLIADVTNLVTSHIQRQKETVDARLVSSVEGVTTNAKQKWQTCLVQSMKLLLQKRTVIESNDPAQRYFPPQYMTLRWKSNQPTQKPNQKKPNPEKPTQRRPKQHLDEKEIREEDLELYEYRCAKHLGLGWMSLGELEEHNRDEHANDKAECNLCHNKFAEGVAVHRTKRDCFNWKNANEAKTQGVGEEATLRHKPKPPKGKPKGRPVGKPTKWKKPTRKPKGNC